MNIINKTEHKISNNFKNNFEYINKLILTYLNKKPLYFSVIFISKAEITNLNSKYLGHKYVTDVLSFKSNIYNEFGDIFICYKQAEKQYKKSIDNEIIFLFIHGFLHLLNYNHHNNNSANKMFSLQNKIIKNIVKKINISEYIISKKEFAKYLS